jgi:hypothetical protein
METTFFNPETPAIIFSPDKLYTPSRFFGTISISNET